MKNRPQERELWGRKTGYKRPSRQLLSEGSGVPPLLLFFLISVFKKQTCNTFFISKTLRSRQSVSFLSFRLFSSLLPLLEALPSLPSSLSPSSFPIRATGTEQRSQVRGSSGSARFQGWETGEMGGEGEGGPGRLGHFCFKCRAARGAAS